MALELDAETRSDVDIKAHGVYRYFASPHADVLFLSYKLDGGPVRRWEPPQPCPQEIINHCAANKVVTAHNAAFERLLWWHILTPRYGWPRPALEQFRCTAATAAAMSLPRHLGDLGEALGLAVQKDKDGYRLIQKFSVPIKRRSRN